MKVSSGVDLHHSVSAGPWKELNVLQSATDDEFQRQRRLHRKKVGCRPGCVACCHAPFSISEIEAATIDRELKTLDLQLQQRLRESALEYLVRRKSVLEEHGYREGRGELVPHEMRLPCPALINEHCTVYRARPTLCRAYGVAVMHANYSDRVFACQLNFAPGEQIQDANLTKRQTHLAQQKATADRVYSETGGKRYHEPITVAHALVEDFETCLPTEYTAAGVERQPQRRRR